MDIFIILHFLEVYASATIDFRVRTKRGKNHYYKKYKQIIYLNIFNIIIILTWLSADAKSAILLRVPSSTKVQVCNFSLLHFPRWLCLVKFQCFCLFDIQHWSVLSYVLLSPSQKSPSPLSTPPPPSPLKRFN